MKKNITIEFFRILYGVSIVSILFKLITIPVTIAKAQLLTNIVSSAVAGDYIGVVQNGLLLLILLLVLKLFDIITKIFYERAKSNSLHKCKVLLYNRYLSSPLNVLYQSTVGESNILLDTDFNTLTNKIVTLYPMMFSGIVIIIVYFIFLFFQSPMIALILLLISSLQIIPPLFIKHFCEKYDIDDKDMEEQVTNTALEYYNGFSTIKIFNLKRWCLERIKKLHHQYWIVANRLQATYQAETAISNVLSNVLNYGTYAIVGLFVISENITMGLGVQAITLSDGLYLAAKNLFQIIPEFGLSKNAEKRMLKFWINQQEDKTMLVVNPDIKVSNVTCVLNGKKILDKINLSILSEGITVLRGENGIGKSTIAKLILGMVECGTGSITIGGIAPSQISYENYPYNIFYLPQEDAIYHLMPNELFAMLLGDNNMTDAFNIMTRFDIKEEICLQKINELSGGERKKIFLTLGLALNPRLLILDEPTNSLDEKSCKILYQLLQERSNGTLIITHEAELVSIASQVYEIKEGGIISEN